MHPDDSERAPRNITIGPLSSTESTIMTTTADITIAAGTTHYTSSSGFYFTTRYIGLLVNTTSGASQAAFRSIRFHTTAAPHPVRHTLPLDCDQVKTNAESAGVVPTDGGYTVYFGGELTEPYTVQCQNMNAEPAMYLKLEESVNSVQWDCTAGTRVTAAYTHVKVVAGTDSLILDMSDTKHSDNTFAGSASACAEGFEVKLGSVRSCGIKATAIVDLRSTLFILTPGVKPAVQLGTAMDLSISTESDVAKMSITSSDGTCVDAHLDGPLIAIQFKPEEFKMGVGPGGMFVLASRHENLASQKNCDQLGKAVSQSQGVCVLIPPQAQISGRDDANTACREKGARLCEAAELEAAASSDDPHDIHAWSTTACSTNPAAFAIQLLGGNATTRLCVRPDTAHDVVCCADATAAPPQHQRGKLVTANADRLQTIASNSTIFKSAIFSDGYAIGGSDGTTFLARPNERCNSTMVRMGPERSVLCTDHMPAVISTDAAEAAKFFGQPVEFESVAGHYFSCGADVADPISNATNGDNQSNATNATTATILDPEPPTAHFGYPSSPAVDVTECTRQCAEALWCNSISYGGGDCRLCPLRATALDQLTPNISFEYRAVGGDLKPFWLRTVQDTMGPGRFDEYHTSGCSQCTPRCDQAWCEANTELAGE